MASKPDAGSESPTACDESWIMIDDVPENDDELDESVLNPVSARARTVSNLVQKMRKLKPKRSTSYGGTEEGRPQGLASEKRGGVINVFRRLRSRTRTSADEGEKQQRAQGERSAIPTIPLQSSYKISHWGRRCPHVGFDCWAPFFIKVMG